MRSEKEQMTAGKEINIVELQLRDTPGEQENHPGSAKHKEEKKEVFSKVRGPGWAACRSSVYTPSEENKYGGAVEVGSLGSAPRTATTRQKRTRRRTTDDGFRIPACQRPCCVMFR